MALLGAAEPSPPRAGADPALPRQLQARRALNEAVCAELRSRITALWDRLQVPAEDRDAFAVHMTGCRAKTRKAVRTPLCWGGGWGGSAGSHPPAGVRSCSQQPSGRRNGQIRLSCMEELVLAAALP